MSLEGRRGRGALMRRAEGKKEGEEKTGILAERQLEPELRQVWETVGKSIF